MTLSWWNQEEKSSKSPSQTTPDFSSCFIFRITSERGVLADLHHSNHPYCYVFSISFNRLCCHLMHVFSVYFAGENITRNPGNVFSKRMSWPGEVFPFYFVSTCVHLHYLFSRRDHDEEPSQVFCQIYRDDIIYRDDNFYSFYHIIRIDVIN